MRRRRFTLAFFCAAVIIGAFPMGERPASAAPRVNGPTVAREVVVDLPARARGLLERDTGTPAGQATGSTGQPVLRFTSQPIDAGQLFDRVGARWVATDHTVGEGSVHVEVRASADGASWGEWQQLKHAHDLDDEPAAAFFAPPRQVGGASRHAQYRLWLTNGDPASVVRLGLTFLDVSDLNAGPVARLINDVRTAFDALTQPNTAVAAVGAPRILSRAAWGADESLMSWTPEYKKPHTKAVIHHTVTGDGGSNIAAELRSIYYFHAVTRGWGDIGYHYLVDKLGNIWTGRQGGDHVEGGHAFGWNNGTFGVASIGDYSVTPPTGALQGAIANIISVKFKQYGIVPTGSDPFTHQEQNSDGSWVNVTTSPPNIIGHRDANYRVGGSGGQTACPGDTIANMMDGLRRLTQTGWENGYTSLFRLDPSLPRGTFPGASFTVPVTVANRGATTIPAGTAVSYQILTPAGAGVVPEGGRGTLGAALAPGGTTSVQVPFTAPPQSGSYIVRWDLHTGSGWWNNVYGTPIRDQWLVPLDWSVDWLSDTVPGALAAGEIRTVQATVLNDGGRTWNAGGTNPVRIGSSWRNVATGNVLEGPRAFLPFDVQPGQTVTLSLELTAPVYPTGYVLRLDLVKENEFWFSDRGSPPDESPVTVIVDAKARLVPGTVPPLAAEQTTSVPVTITNTGRGTFPTTSSTPVRLSYHWYDAQGRTLVWDGARTALPADLAAGQSVTVNAVLTAPASGGTLTLKWDLVQEGVAWFSSRGVPTTDQQVTVGGSAATYGATYRPQAIASATAYARSVVPMALVNTGSLTWRAGGANPVRLAYHWWSPATGSTVIWDGMRTALPADVPAGGSVSLNANVEFPGTAGTYVLRWDLVEEGVTWFSGQGVATGDQTVRVDPPPPYAVRFGTVPAITYVAGNTYTLNVPVTNIGSATWNASGSNPITLSYHWHNSAGGTVVWDGIRTPLPADVAPGATITLAARVAAPAAGTGYTLTFDMIREGVSWFESLGGTPLRVTTNVESARWGARYDVPPTSAAGWGETKTIQVTVTNTGNVTWNAAGPNPVNLSYHLFDGSGRTVVWDGIRTPLGTDLAPGQSRVMSLTYTAPAAMGTYTLSIEALREGISWFSGYGIPAASSRLSVSSGYNAGYLATTTPAQVFSGTAHDLTVDVVNYGPRSLARDAVRLSYHIHTAAGAAVVWDGARGVLPRDIAPGETLRVPIRVQFPSALGDYRLSWDLVEEGVGWFSSYGVQMKVEPVSVVGLTFYGKGFGHGVGMSQHGAQALATGAGGTSPQTGEQIIQHYYRGTQISPINTTAENAGIRVLLSTPSSTGSLSCGSPALNVALVDVKGWGAVRIYDEGAGNAFITTAASREPFQVHAINGLVRVWRNTGTPTMVYQGPGPVVFVADPAGSLEITQKGTYRGNTRFANSGGVLRVMNYVNYDHYAMGVIRKEMPGGWHHEAYKAQAYAAKAYGFTSYRGSAGDYDVRDDQADQCYGGVGAESTATNAAVEATRGKIPTYNGQVIRAYFSSSSGGYTVPEGCWGTRLVLLNGRWTCGPSQPYLQAVPDPADLLLTSPAPNPHASWQATFTGDQIRTAVLNMRGIDIGALISVDLSNQSPAGGHVVSVLVRGTAAVVDLQADVLLRTHLGLKSTYVRLNPF